MFVLNSQFTSVTATTAPAAAVAALAKYTTRTHIRQEWKRLMLCAIHLHSHWAIIIDSAEANKVWFDVLSGLCSIFFLFTLQWCEAFLFSCMIRIIAAYTMISSCVRMAYVCGREKIVFGKSLWKSMDSVESHQWPVFDKRLPIEVRNQHPEKFNHAFVFLTRAYSFSFALNEVKMRTGIVHAKLANGQKSKDRSKERKEGRMGRWKKLKCVGVHGWKKSWRK